MLKLIILTVLLTACGKSPMLISQNKDVPSKGLKTKVEKTPLLLRLVAATHPNMYEAGKNLDSGTYTLPAEIKPGFLTQDAVLQLTNDDFTACYVSQGKYSDKFILVDFIEKYGYDCRSSVGNAELGEKEVMINEGNIMLRWYENGCAVYKCSDGLVFLELEGVE